MTKQTRLTTVFVELADTLVEDFDVIEQAKGVLSARADNRVGEAFAVLRAHARRQGGGLTAVAQAVLDGSLDHTTLVDAGSR